MLPRGEKLFWLAVAGAGLLLAVQLCSNVYVQWRESPVITTLHSTNHPIQVPGPGFTGLGVFKDDSNRHSNLRRQENWVFRADSAWKLVFMPT